MDRRSSELRAWAYRCRSSSRCACYWSARQSCKEHTPYPEPVQYAQKRGGSAVRQPAGAACSLRPVHAEQPSRAARRPHHQHHAKTTKNTAAPVVQSMRAPSPSPAAVQPGRSTPTLRTTPAVGQSPPRSIGNDSPTAPRHAQTRSQQ